MACERSEVESFFSVGTVMMLHSQPGRRDSPRFRSTLRGWRVQQHLILDRPRDAHGSYILLQERSECVLRFLREGQACACVSEVLTWDAHKNSPYLRVRWPREVTCITFRKCERVPLRLPCTVARQDGTQTREELRDLSIAGCSVFSRHICAEGAILRCSFDLPDGVSITDLEGTARNVRETNGGFLLGIELKEGQELQKNDIAFFVSSTLARRRVSADTGDGLPAILLLDEESTVFDNLRGPLKSLGLELVWAANLVDGMHRLRMVSPKAVLVRQEFSPLSGVEVCRTIRSVKGLESLPLWIYGAAPREFTQQCRDAGANGYFPPARDLSGAISMTLAPLLGPG